jgi:hypothetical protein
MIEEKYISRIEAAKQFGCAPQTISNWLSDGFLQGKMIKDNDEEVRGELYVAGSK